MFNSNASSAAGGDANYIEDVFSTWLYTGTGPLSQTITNGIDLAGKGGLVWTKARTQPFALNHSLIDTVRGNRYQLYSDLTNAQVDLGTTPSLQAISSFNSNGFTLGGDQSSGCANYSSAATYASWTFRKQPKFFDVVTYTGTGATQTISHNLGSTPGCIMIKKTSVAQDWLVYHRGLTGGLGANGGACYVINLNTTSAEGNQGAAGPTASSTSVTLSTNWENDNGATYVMYLFAHNAGGFGLTGTDNVISCDSFTTATSTLAVTLGYEPQWLLFKRKDAAGDWQLYDNMRGMTDQGSRRLYPNLSNAEDNGAAIQCTATGFTVNTTYNASFIYIAIRRGPMKVPTDGTSVFTPATWTGTGTATTITSAGFPVDLVIGNSRNAASYGSTGAFGDRLRGKQNLLYSPSTGAEDTANVSITGFDVQNGISVGDTNAYSFNYSGGSYVNWFFRRAPGFFDEACYTGNGTTQALTHNLGVVPELMIVKNRGTGTNWAVYSSALGATQTLFLNTTATPSTITSIWNDTAPTSSVFTVGSAAATNTSTNTYVAYLFASCPGVSKVGSYTGTGTAQTINCGFTTGARFVLIKRTDSTGDWYVWDSARGIVAGNDPYLLLNSTAAEVTSTDYVDTYSAGFELTSTAPAALNASGGSYIFLAIA